MTIPTSRDSFLSTPSARRATGAQSVVGIGFGISIHALREEGDFNNAQRANLQNYFYPRPPRGGRPLKRTTRSSAAGYFYPRPPRGGRPRRARRGSLHRGFLSTPSARRATRRPPSAAQKDRISIHALREEGDSARRSFFAVSFAFLSTPSARRATCRPLLP